MVTAVCDFRGLRKGHFGGSDDICELSAGNPDWGSRIRENADVVWGLGKSRRGGYILGALLGMLLGPSMASAQFSIEQYTLLSPSDRLLLSQPTAQIARKGAMSLGIRSNYSFRPLVAIDTENIRRVADVVRNRVATEIAFAYSFGVAEIWAALPVVLFQDFIAEDGVMLESFGDHAGLADARIGGRYRIHGGEKITLAAALEFSLPTHFEAEFSGQTGFTATPQVIGDFRGEHAFLAIRVGGRVRKSRRLGDLSVGPALLFGIGASYAIPRAPSFRPVIELQGEIAGGVVRQSPIEVRAGLRWVSKASCYSGSIGYGRGVARGFGAPAHRAMLSVECSFGGEKKRGPFRKKIQAEDPDGDGVLGTSDDCPNEPEDFDGNLDLDGCPEPDNDEDGVLDVDDKCVDEPEDIDGFEDEDGCRDEDNDGDNIADEFDKCPVAAETVNGINDLDGCPDALSSIAKIVGKRIVLSEQIRFAKNSAKLSQEANLILKQVATLISSDPTISQVTVVGHTEDIGPKSKNYKISVRMSKAVVQKLTSLGVAPARLRPSGAGEKKPITSNETKEGRAKNRRVEFLIKSRGKNK